VPIGNIETAILTGPAVFVDGEPQPGQTIKKIRFRAKKVQLFHVIPRLPLFECQ
jgi:hypothetical protein